MMPNSTMFTPAHWLLFRAIRAIKVIRVIRIIRALRVIRVIRVIRVVRLDDAEEHDVGRGAHTPAADFVLPNDIHELVPATCMLERGIITSATCTFAAGGDCSE